MQQLINNSVTFSQQATSTTQTYRDGMYWQFSSFNAGGATLSPIGSSSGAPFSGTISGVGGTATIQNLRIQGGGGTGLFGWTSSSISISGIHLTNFEMSVSNNAEVDFMGSLVGSNTGNATITNCSVSGTVSGAVSGVGGLVGYSRDGPLVLDQVSFTGAIITQSETGEVGGKGDDIGGLVGYVYGSDVTIKNAVFDGKVIGRVMVGGLVGYAWNGSVDISKVSVRAKIIAHVGPAGGLIATLSYGLQSGSPKLTIDNALVVGSIWGSSDSTLAPSNLAGLVGYMKSTGYEASISSVISAVDLYGEGVGIAGLINTDTSNTMSLNSVLNLARFASSSSSHEGTAALVYSSNGISKPFTHTHAYYWQGVSANSETYHPFTSGTISSEESSTWKFNGVVVNCSSFRDINFWTGSDSMSLATASGWNFNNITSGYLPSLNAKFTDQTFSCVNIHTIDKTDAGTIKPISGVTELETMPVYNDPNSSARYFTPSSTSTLYVRATVTNTQVFYGIWLNDTLFQPGQLGATTFALPEATIWSDNKIRMSFTDHECDNAFSNIGTHQGTAGDPFRVTSFRELLCMQHLVNNEIEISYGSSSGTLYRNAQHWQFSSFDAGGATLGPIGSSTNITFSGTISGVGGTATISNLNIHGGDRTALFGNTSDSFSLSGVHLVNVNVSASGNDGTYWLGSIIGSNWGPARITNCTVSGTVSGLASAVGGLVGDSRTGPLVLEQVSFTGSVIGNPTDSIGSKGDDIGGLVGWVYASDISIQNAAFDGKLVGKSNVGGLIGYAQAGSNVAISKVSARASIISHNGSAGGLIGTLAYTGSGSTSSRDFKIDNAVAVGSISVSSGNDSAATNIAGLVGNMNAASYSTTISSVISGVDLFGEGGGVAGLINATYSATMTVNSVLNLARVNNSSASGYDVTAALVNRGNGSTVPFFSERAYHWQGLSASGATYHPFTSGTISGDNNPWRFNGVPVNCSSFSDVNFWTSSESMSLLPGSGWNFSKIAAGYLPSLNGHFSDQPFNCMNTIVHPDGWQSFTLSPGFGLTTALLKAESGTTSLFHYYSATISPNTASYSVDASLQAGLDVIIGTNLLACSISNNQYWLVPPSDLMQDAIITVRGHVTPCVVPNFSFTLTVEGTNLLLKWTAENTSSVVVSFPKLINTAGGNPPVISSESVYYSGTDTAFTHTLGEPMVGTYTISASGSYLGYEESKWRVVDTSFLWSLHLPEVTPIGKISFPDVFTGAARTITYKSGSVLKPTRVTAVNAGRLAAIHWLASVGVTAGSGSTSAGQTTYRPMDSVNRGAMAQFLQKLAGFTDDQIAKAYANKSTNFTDIGDLKSSNLKRYYAILWLADTGITAGCNDPPTKFCPGNGVNRGAMAEFMRKFAGVAATEANTSPFPDVFTSTGTYKNLTYDTKKTERVAGLSASRVGAINWMRITEITLGSGSIKGVTTYRAQDAVNRGAMAEFMRKLAIYVGSTPAT
jgi:hypothetical protein